MTNESMNFAELAAAQLRDEALLKVAEAEARVEEGRALIAQGERQVREGEAAVAEARMGLRAAEDFIAKLRHRLKGGQTASRTARPVAPTHSATARSTAINGGRSMIPVMEEMMSDGGWHTIDELFERMRAEGYKWSRGSLMNRLSDRAKRGRYVRRVREDGKSAYKLAAANGGDTLLSGGATPEGGRELNRKEAPSAELG